MAEINMNENRKWLYDALTNKGVQMGAYEEFDKNVDANKDWLYNTAKSKGVDIGDYDAFDKAMSNGQIPAVTVPHPEQRQLQQPQPRPKSPYVEGKGDDTMIFGVSYTDYQQMSPEEQSKQYSAAIEKRKNDEKNFFSNYITGQLGEIDSELNKEREPVAMPAGSAFIPSSAVGAAQRFGNGDTKETQDRYTSLHAAKNLLDDANKLVEESKKGDTGFFSSLGRGFKDRFMDTDNWTMGLTDTAYSGLLRKAIEKEESGEELSPEESKLLDAAAVNMATQAYFSSDMSRGYKAGSTTAQSIPFMLEFAINPVSSSGNALAKGLLKHGLKRFGRAATSNAAKVAGRLVGDAAAAAGMTATSSIGRVASGTNERMIGDVQATVEDGEIKYAGRENGMEVGEALGKSAVSNFLENQSEMVFNAFAGGGKMAKEALSKFVPGLSKLSNSEIVQFISKIKNNPTIKNVANRTQFHGLLGEYAEEVYNNFANIPLGEMTVEQATDLDNNIDTFLGLAPTSAAFGLLGLGGMAREKYTAQRNLHRFRNSLNEEDKTLFDELQQVINAGDQETTKAFIGRTLADANLTPEEKKERVFAVQDMQEEKVLEDVQNEDATAGITPEDIEANKVDIYRDYKRAERKVNSLLPEELTSQLDAVSDLGQFASANNLNEQQVSALADYLPAKEMYLQYVSHTDRRREEAKTQAREQAMADIEKISNPETGLVVQAKHKFADNPVYLVGGNLSFGEDGFLDRDSSSETIYYVDETGERKMAQAEDFDSVLSEVPIDDMIVLAEANAEQDFIANEEESLRSPDIPAPERGVTVNIGGDTYVIENPDDDIPGNYSAAKLDANGEIDTHGNITSLSPDEYYAAKEAELWKVAERTTQNVHKSDNMSEKYLESATGTPMRESKVSEDAPTDEQSQETPEQKMQRVIASLPKKNGSIDYKSMTPQQQFDYTSAAESPEVAIEDLRGDVAAKNEELEKINARLAKATGSERVELRDIIRSKKKELDDLKTFFQSVEPTQSVTFESNKDEEVQVPEDVRTDEDYISWVADNSDDANEVLGAYSAAKDLASHEQTLKPWQRELLGRKVSTSSFNRFGDRNQITGALAKGWLRKDGQEIDAIAQELSENGVDVTEQDIVDFMLTNPSNHVSQVSNTMRSLSSKFSEIATKEMGIPVGGPESNTGRLYIQLKEADQKIDKLTDQQKNEVQEALTADMDASDTQRTDSYYEALGDYVQQYDQFRNEFDEEGADEAVIQSMEENNPELYHGGFTAAELDDIYSQIENNNGTEGQAEDSRENQSPLSGEEVEQHEESGAPEVAATENRESEEQNNGVVSNEQFEIVKEQKQVNIEQPTINDLSVVEPSSSIQENGNNALNSEDNSVPLQGDNQKVNKNDEVSQSIPQGEHGTLPEISGEQEEPVYQLRRRIEEASRNASESERGRGRQQEVNQMIETQAKENGLWTPIQNLSHLGTPFLSGNENDTYLDRENAAVYKTNNLVNSKNLPELFKRIDLHNELFPQTKYELVGFTGFGNGGTIYPIYKQEYIDNAEFATPEEIGAYMQDLGFNKAGEAEYSNGDITISDLYPRNVLKDTEGDIYVIDADFKRNILTPKENNPAQFTSPQLESEENVLDYANRVSEAKRLFDAEQEVDTNPTEAQKSAGNYKKGHIKIDGYDITIENPKGSERSGVDTNGQPWSVTMNNSYGYIRGTEGVDGDHIDVFLSDNPADGKVYVIDQMNEDGFFDEHKVMYGFPSAETARAAYLANYSPGWKGLGAISEVSQDEFKKWIDSSHRKTKPFVDYKSVKVENVQTEIQGEFTEKSPSPQENSGETAVKLPKSGSNVKNKKRAADIKQARYELMDAKRELSVAQAVNSMYTPDEVEEKKKRVKEAENTLKKLTNKISDDSVRFREVEDGDITSLAQKHNLNEDDVRKYAQSINVGNLGGASYAFKNIKRSIRLLNSDLSLSEFVKAFAPVKAELYEKLGNVDALRDEYVQQEMEQRNVMEAARKRAEEEAETERKRLEEFELMTDTEMDVSYFKALEENDESRMRDIVNEAARRKGYVSADEFRMAHRAPSYDEEGYDKSLVDVASDKDNIRQSLNEQLKMNRDKYKNESAFAINEALSAIDEGKHPTVTIYRAVPKSLKEGRVRNGDWISLSESYVKTHGEHTLNGDYNIMKEEVPAENIYWDGNDINEWGYDDRSDYRYKDTKNNRKLSDLITRDDNGNIIPPSKRFNARKADTRFREKDFYSKEEQSIIDKAKEDGSYMKTPNGKKTSLSDKQWVQVRTKAFKNWFGDWENSSKDASKVVDKNGEPLVVYHGTLSKSIERFRKDMIGSRYSYDESGFFFTDKESIAKDYSASEFDSTVKGDIIPVFLNIRKPIMADNRWAVKNGLGNALKNMDSIEFWDNYQSFMLDEIEDQKKDGAIINDGSSKMLVVFEPNQIKSATENIGEFSSSNDAIRLRENSEDLHEINAAKVLAAITKLSDVLHTHIHMPRTVEELPDGAAKRAIERGRNIKAWYDTNTGEVSVYIPNLNNASDAVKSVLHEVVGHKGLRDLFGKEEFDGIMERLYGQLPENARKEVNDAAEAKYNGSVAVAMDEYLAEQAEKDETPSWWSRVVSAMRDFLREIGVDVKLTGDDVKYLLWKSRNRLMNTDDSIAVINKIAADEGMKERFHIGEYSRTAEQEKADYERSTKVVSDFAQSHAGAGNALVIRSRDIMRKQLAAIGISNKSIDEIEDAFNSGEAVAIYNEEAERVIISNNGASDKELKAYLWHENTHRAIREIFGDKAEEVIEPVYEWLSAKNPKGCEIVKNRYSERSDAVQKEECIVKFVEDKIKKSGEETFQQELKNASPVIKEVFEGIFNFIAYGTTERTGEESNKLLGRTLGAGHELEVRNSDASGFKEEKREKASEGTESSGRETGQEPEVIRFRDTTDKEQSDGTREAYEEAINTKGRWGKARLSQYNFQEAFQDEMLSVKILQEIIEEHSGKKLKGYENAYLAENRLGSTNLQERNKFVEEFYEPMMKIMDGLIKEGVSEKEIKDYLIAKSGLERNREFAVRDAIAAKEKDDGKKSAQELREKYEGSRDILRKQYADGKVEWDDYQGKLDELAALYAHKFRDYSGLTAITGDKEGFTDKAKDIVRQFETTHDVKPLWNSINAATKATLKKSYDSGITSKATYDHVAGMFEYYIPMRGWAEDTAEDVYDYINQGGGAFSATIKAAGGHEHESYDPFAAIGNMAESAILQGNRNLIKQKFMNMVLNHPSDVAKLSQVWYKKKDDGKWEASFPEIAEDATPDKVAKAIEDHQKEMLDLEKDGKAECRSNKLDVNYHIDPKNISQHAVVVKRNGVDFVIYINGNPRAAEALNGKLKMEQGGGWNFYDYLKRLYSAGMTSYNVNFVGANVSRDVHHAFFITYMEKGVKEAAKLAANGGTAFKTVYRGVSGKLDLNRKADVYYKEFLENGGETGYSNLNSMEAWKEDNDKRIARLKGIAKKAGYAKLGLERLGEWFEFANRIAENATRFNAYMLARENGKGVFDAVNEAKNITVNFNKKGSAQTPGFFGIAANIFRRWVLFANPIIQGLYQMYNVGKQHKVRFASAFAFHAALGFMLPVLNTFLVGMYGDDDDDYFNQNDYTRRNNLMLYIPKLGYLKLPLAPVFRNMYAMGDILYMKLNDLSTTEDLFWDSINEARAMLSIEGQSGRKEWSPSRFLLPDLVGPIVDVTENENFAGAPIYKDTEFNKFDPEFKKVYKDAWGSLTELSRVMNSFDGGNDYRKADHIGKWLNPAAMQHLITNYTGGVGQLIGDASSMLLDAFNGDMKENFSMMKVPVAKRFFTIPDERTSGSAIRKKYFRIKEEMDKLNHEVKERAKDAGGDLKKLHELSRLQNSKEYDWLLEFKAYSRRMNRMNNPQEKIELMQEVVDWYKEKTKGK